DAVPDEYHFFRMNMYFRPTAHEIKIHAVLERFAGNGKLLYVKSRSDQLYRLEVRTFYRTGQAQFLEFVRDIGSCLFASRLTGSASLKRRRGQCGKMLPGRGRIYFRRIFDLNRIPVLSEYTAGKDGDEQQ